MIPLLGSNVKTDAWSNAYSRHLYSDLTGTIRELTSADGADDADTRFQPPLDTDNPKVQPLIEGYRVANAEITSPAKSVSSKKETFHERQKRDTGPENSSTPAASANASASGHVEPTSSRLLNNTTENEAVISDDDASSWALSLSLAASIDGSGSEYESELPDEHLPSRHLSICSHVRSSDDQTDVHCCLTDRHQHAANSPVVSDSIS